MSERLLLKGALSEKRKQAINLAARAQGLIRAVKIALRPEAVTPLRDIRVTEARELVCELEDVRERYLQLVHEIDEIEKELR